MILIAAVGAFAWLKPWRSSSEPPPATTSAPGPAAPREPALPPVRAPAAAAPPAERSAEDERFVERLLEADVRAEFSGIDLDAATIRQLASGHIAEVAVDLEKRAAGGDGTANVVLSILQDCSGILSEVLQTLQADESRSAARDLPEARRARIELALDVRRAAAETAARSCRDARFDRPMIAERLRTAGAAGHEPSLRRQGEITTDVRARIKLWTSAAMLGHVPAQLDLAQHYRREFMSGQRGGGRMKTWMDIAAKESAAGKLLLADCHFNGCVNAPPDPARGARLLREAAAAGDLEAIEKLVAERDNPDFSLEERAAWSEFRDRLNEMGCYGTSEYARVSVASWRMLEETRAVSPYFQEQEGKLAGRYWKENGTGARHALGCV